MVKEVDTEEVDYGGLPEADRIEVFQCPTAGTDHAHIVLIGLDGLPMAQATVDKELIDLMRKQIAPAAMNAAETHLHNLAMRYYSRRKSSGDWGVMFQCLIQGNEDVLRTMVEAIDG